MLTISILFDLSLVVNSVRGCNIVPTHLVINRMKRMSELSPNWKMNRKLTSPGMWRSSNQIACAILFCLCGRPMSLNIQSRADVSRGRWEGVITQVRLA